MVKKRTDILLFEQGLAESRSMAQRLVMAGQVRADGQLVQKSSTLLDPETKLTVKALPRYVSRGGYKLEAALKSFDIQVQGAICADVGASTGGFTDCLLQQGAEKVYAIDVGHGQLHWKLRQDERVVNMEKNNARYLSRLPEKVDMISIDASFISLEIILPVVRAWLKEKGQILALIKPQFESGKREAELGKGVIRDPKIHQKVLENILRFSRTIELFPLGMMASPIKGPKGNVEFLLWLSQNKSPTSMDKELVSSALAMAKDVKRKYESTQ